MRRAAERPRNNPLNTKPGMNDLNQRYRVEYKDGLGTRCTFGFTDDLAEAGAWCARIDKNLAWRFPSILDRKTKRRVKVAA